MYKQRQSNSDRRENKIPTFYDDYYTPFVAWFVEHAEGFEHLMRPRKYWRMPKGVHNYRRKNIFRQGDSASKRGSNRRHRAS